METPRHILVVIDPHATQHPALGRARHLARAFGASIELFVCYTPRDRELQLNSADLERVAAELRAEGIICTIDVATEPTVHNCIVRKVLRSPPSLVIKDARPHTLLRRSWLVNTDWQLTRLCPVPVLFVHPGPWDASPRIAAAVDVAQPGEKPAQLDHALLSTAETFALATDGVLHAVHAYVPVSTLAAGATVRAVSLASEVTPDQVITDNEALVREDFSTLFVSHHVPRERRHLVAGAPSEALLRFVRQNNIDLLVMGAYARGWVYNVMVGSTTERILDLLPCDVLVLKPASFECPLRRPAEPYAASHATANRLGQAG
jgi:universal stress protein E